MRNRGSWKWWVVILVRTPAQLSMFARRDFKFVIPSAKRKILLPQNIHIFAEFLSNTLRYDENNSAACNFTEIKLDLTCLY